MSTELPAISRAAPSAISDGPLLSVHISGGYPGKPDALKEIRFEIRPGEVLGLIGKSGSGKSTIALAIPRLLELRGGFVRGTIRFAGCEILSATARELRELRGKEIALVMQSPMTALNPALRIETQLREVWRAHRRESWQKGKLWACELLSRMGLPADDRFLGRFPRQLSVGQAQRVVISMAVMHKPKLLIADEPTSALDSQTASEIIDLFRSLNRQCGTAVLYISHDLETVASLCHSVAIVSEGRILDYGPVEPSDAGTTVRALSRALNVAQRSHPAVEFADPPTSSLPLVPGLHRI